MVCPLWYDLWRLWLGALFAKEEGPHDVRVDVPGPIDPAHRNNLGVSVGRGQRQLIVPVAGVIAQQAIDSETRDEVAAHVPLVVGQQSRVDNLDHASVGNAAVAAHRLMDAELRFELRAV